MKFYFAKFVICVLHLVWIVNAINEKSEKACFLQAGEGSQQFPESFSFGASTSAYQIEGAWNADGKGPSIWDTFTHEHPSLIKNQSNGDIAADSYNKFEQDLEALKELKVRHYRFSISWTRILPNGEVNNINQKGIDYYNMIIDKLLANGIEPMVTMLHYDYPKPFDNFGGLTNKIFVRYFNDYADLLFKLFGDRVKIWITFNEPYVSCMYGYNYGSFPPSVKAPGTLEYVCVENVLIAHATVYHNYKKNYFEKQKGKIGISLNSPFFFSKDNNTELVNRGVEYWLGWLAHPIFHKTGNYPDVMIEDIARNSIREGRKRSRLNPIDSDNLKMIQGSADFLGLNYYTSSYVEEMELTNGTDLQPSHDNDLRINYIIDPERKRAKTTWIYCFPEGLEGILKWIRDNYNNIEVIITENGYSDDGELNDLDRIEYTKAHLQGVLNAINNGCNVTKYIYWSLIDNLEWLEGYTEKFGLYHVDMDSPNKERTPKRSARYYRNVIASKRINVPT